MTIRKLFRIFITTTIVLLLIIMGLLSFYVWKVGEDQRKLAEAKGAAAAEKIDNNILDTKFSDVSKEGTVCTVIYLGSPGGKGLISSAYICLFDRNAKTLAFTSIPGDTFFEISNELYKELSVSQAELGQTVRLSHIYKYFGSENGFKAGVFMLNEYLGINAGHYLYIPAKYAEQIFYFNSKGKSVFNSEFQKSLIAGDGLAEDIVNDAMKARYSDISKSKLLKLISEMKGMKASSISFRTIPGRQYNRGFMVDTEKAVTEILKAGEG